MLKISGFYDSSCTNGEGWRSVVFFSGCPHRCKGCHNPETWDGNNGTDISVEDLTNKVLANASFIDGVTLSGGEPFQEKNINQILTFIHNVKLHNLNVWCYTGYKLEDLVKNKLYVKLLKEIDVLIDGPFIESLYDPELKFRGSSNQKVIELKNVNLI